MPNSIAHARGQYTARVVSNRPLCREHFELALRVASFPATAPGQFVQLACNDAPPDEPIEHEWIEGAWPRLRGVDLLHAEALLRRPFSLAGRREKPEGAELLVVHRVVGLGTDWLSRLAPGDAVGVLGPLGNRFTLPAPRGIALLVGGGVGIPPMLYLAQALAGRGRCVAFCGATSLDLLPLTLTDDAPPPTDPASAAPLYNVQEFARHGIPAVLSTDDGSYGFRGYVTDALERYLDVWISAPADRALTTIYACGPEPMLKRVQQVALSRGLRCEIAVERAMACGMGTCQSCCIRVGDERAWAYRLACTDGPIFDAARLLW